MDPSAQAAAVNQNFEQLASEARTKIIVDEDGKKRIILGKFPDGTYGFAISIEGVDVLEALQE